MENQTHNPPGRAQLTERFGDLSLTMLNESPLLHAWRFNFLANFFVGPVYRVFDEKHDISRPEFVILFCLSQQPGLVARDVCLVTGLPKNSISRAVARLLDKKLIERQTNKGDARAKTLILTKPGKDKLADLVPLFAHRQTQMRTVLSDEELAQFDQLITKMVSAMPDWVDEI